MGADCSRPMRMYRQYGPSYYLEQYGGGNRCLCSLSHHHNRHYMYHGMRRSFDPIEYIAAGGRLPQHWADPGDWTLRDVEVMSGLMRDVNDRMELNLARNRRDARHPLVGGYGSGYDDGWNGGGRGALLRRLEDIELRMALQGGGGDAVLRRDIQDVFRMNNGVGGAAIAVAQAAGGNLINDIGYPCRREDFANRYRDPEHRGQGERQRQQPRGNGGGNSSGHSNRREHDQPFLVNMNNVRIGNINDLENDLVYPMMEHDRHHNPGGRRVQYNENDDYEPYYKRFP